MNSRELRYLNYTWQARVRVRVRVVKLFIASVDVEGSKLNFSYYFGIIWK